MTTDTRRRIDHVVVVVDDLEEAATRVAEAGFVVTARSDHPFGTSNRLVVLADSYMEMVTVTDPGALPEAGFARFVADSLASGRTGVRMVAMLSGDLEEDCRRLATAGFETSGPLRFGREALLPDGSTVTVEFEVAFPPLLGPGLYSFFCRHLTPESVWHPSTLGHANGATELLAVGVDQPGSGAWAQLAFLADVPPDPTLRIGRVMVEPGASRVVVAAERHVGVTLDGWELMTEPWSD